MSAGALQEMAPSPFGLVNMRGLVEHFAPYGISGQWLREEAKAGRLKGTMIGGRRFFSIRTVENQLLERAANDVLPPATPRPRKLSDQQTLPIP